MPTIVTPLPFLEEYGMKHGENCYVLEFDCSNVNEIAKNITKIPKGKVKIPEDIYGKLLAPSKSIYKCQLDTKWLVEATNKYQLTNTSDNGLAILNNKKRYIPVEGYRWGVDFSRKENLVRNGFVKVVKEIKKEEQKCITESEKTKKKNCKKEEQSNT